MAKETNKNNSFTAKFRIFANAIGRKAARLRALANRHRRKLSITMKNKNLHDAKVAKKDEFYTRLEDIGNELKHYRDFFRGKSVLCNCDDPYESNFFKFFALNFNAWGLRKLVATCYDGSPIAGQQLELPFDDAGAGPPPAPPKILDARDPAPGRRRSYKIEITEVPDMNGDGAVDMTDVDILISSDKNVLTKLKGNGDFRSAECVEMLKEADVVVTNPPFSLFREYVAQLVEYDKKFLIIGPQNAITYKEIFPLIKENKIWLGYGFAKGNAYFNIPQSVIDDKIYVEGVYDAQTRQVHFRNCHWFTNIDHKKRHETLDLYKTYTPEEYPTYDNYDAINVDKTADIPMDYDGVMGVPITLMDKYNPEQFEILSITDRDCPLKTKEYTKEETPNYGDLNRRGALNVKGVLKSTYARILIKRKQQ